MDNLISIIVPHYNTPDSLLRLIRSIPIRKDIEVLVVDDNSQILFEELCHNLIEFPHVRLFKNNSGVKGAGACRNIALHKAVGKWVLFADADDFFMDGFYENLVPYLESDFDMIYFAPTSMDESTGRVSSRHLYYMELVNRYCDNKSLKNLTTLKYDFCTPWSKLIRRSIFEEYEVDFDEIIVSNDIMCMTKCAFYSHKIEASKNIIYCVTRGAETLTSGKNEGNFDLRVKVLIRRYCFLREHLSKKEFNYSHIKRRALGKLIMAVADHWGIRKLIDILKLYHENKIRFLDADLLNPVTLFHEAKSQLIQLKDIKKHR